MDFRDFAVSRDLLYITGAVSGIGLGLLFGLFRKDLDKRARNRRITLSMVFFSGTVAGLAIAFIVSFGGIFQDLFVLLLSGIGIVLCALAVCFPRAVAYPLLLLSGLAAVFLGFACLRFPVYGADSAVMISRLENPDSGTVYLIEYASAGNTGLTVNDSSSDNENWTFQIQGAREFLNCTVTVLDISPQFPFIGGRKQGFISAINSDAGVEYADNSLQKPLTRGFYALINSFQPVLGIGINHLVQNITLDNITPGSKILVPFIRH
jgi:hypothetical protein